MLLLWGVILGLAVGFARGGSIANLDDLDIHYLPLVLVALIIQLLIFPLFTQQPIITFGTEIFHFISYAVLTLFVLLNLKVWGVLLMGAGMGANIFVIIANGGFMPSSPLSLIKAGEYRAAYHLTQAGTYGNVIHMNSSTAFEFLGDWLYLPRWIPFSTAFSLGDLLIAVGLLFFFGAGMVKG